MKEVKEEINVAMNQGRQIIRERQEEINKAMKR
jgi:hypothetical protein